jgi:hypothetical protein
VVTHIKLCWHVNCECKSSIVLGVVDTLELIMIETILSQPSSKQYRQHNEQHTVNAENSMPDASMF